mgnify:CR=1 FL=1
MSDKTSIKAVRTNPGPMILWAAIIVGGVAYLIIKNRRNRGGRQGEPAADKAAERRPPIVDPRELRWVWLTHDDAGVAGGDDMPGPAPQFFFAPDQMRKRISDWGREGLDQRFADAWRTFAPVVAKPTYITWLTLAFMTTASVASLRLTAWRRARPCSLRHRGRAHATSASPARGRRGSRGPGWPRR